ncbi:mitochondrial carrier [Clavulina sp. PMI_390]|nr:mitochondrial carrier [Clavulina sp. PMI_390]
MSETLHENPRAGSLRGGYSPVSSEWTFDAPTPGAAGAGSASSSAAAAGSSTKSTASSPWSTAPPPSRTRVLDASPYPLDDLDPAYTGELDLRNTVKWLVSAAVLQYATTGIAMPFEVAKILLQCQWIPKEAVEGEFLGRDGAIHGQEDEEADKDDAMSDVSAESYFHDPGREAFSAATQFEAESSQRKLHPTDADGYVMRQSIMDASTRPDYVMAIGSTDGVWSMMRRIREFKPEGWTALWKSQFTSTVLETLTPVVQSSIQTVLMSIFVPESAAQAYPLLPSRLPPSHLAISLTSHILTGVVLSPLDIVRTRLIVQSSHPSHRAYAGPLDGLRKLFATEGGWRGVYTHPAYLIPAILDNTIRPLLTLSTPIFLHRWLGIEEDTHPFSYAIASCAFASAALVVTLPFETIRRRMQVQSHPAGLASLQAGQTPALATSFVGGIQACVELSPRPYVGVIDTAWRIISEERSAPRRRRKRVVPPRRRSSAASNTGAGRRASFKGKEPADAFTGEESETDEFEEDDGWFSSSGVAQLYRGFSMGLTANVVVFALSAFGGVVGDDGSSSGWTEL